MEHRWHTSCIGGRNLILRISCALCCRQAFFFLEYCSTAWLHWMLEVSIFYHFCASSPPICSNMEHKFMSRQRFLQEMVNKRIYVLRAPITSARGKTRDKVDVIARGPAMFDRKAPCPGGSYLEWMQNLWGKCEGNTLVTVHILIAHIWYCFTCSMSMLRTRRTAHCKRCSITKQKSQR